MFTTVAWKETEIETQCASVGVHLREKERARERLWVVVRPISLLHSVLSRLPSRERKKATERERKKFSAKRKKYCLKKMSN